jgi:hypothetical protein
VGGSVEATDEGTVSIVLASVDTRGSEAVWVCNAGAGTDDVVATRVIVSVT